MKRVRRTREGQSNLIERLEDRELLSASPVILRAVTPKSISAGGSGTEVVTVRNLTAAPVTEAVTVTLAPSLDGVTAAGTYSSSPFDETFTIKKHGAVSFKVPFTPESVLAGGKYHTLATVTLGAETITATAPGVYTYIAPTTTPSLVGEFSGAIISYKSTSSSTGLFGHSTSTTVHTLTFRWNDTAQDLDSVTGTFSVGDQAETGVMTGTELSNGKFSYTFSSDLINYTVTGTVTDTAKNGIVISGVFLGTLQDNLFSTLDGKFKLTAGSKF